MNRAGSRLIVGHLLWLAGGALVGWLSGRADLGLMVAALAGLAWQLRSLLIFERSLRTKNFEQVRYGDGIWSQIHSRISYIRRRGKDRKKRYRHLLKEIRKSANALPDGGVVLNEQFEMILCNAAAERLVGLRPREDRGRRVDHILRAPSFAAYLGRGLFDGEVEIPSPVAEGNWLSLRIVPYGAGQRLLLIRDITERRRLTATRRAFVANASHELRSPLTVISGYLDTLVTDPGMPEEWRSPLDQMQRQATRMNKIVADLLELSRLDAGGTAPADELVDVAGLLAAARKTAAGRPAVPDIELMIQSNARVRGSTAEIESVIDNLLSNAIRYSRAASPITLQWASDEDGAKLTVADAGVGIEAEHIPRLTERFYRVDPGRDREHGGVGLGLAIVKHVLERHAATLHIESQPGKGSRFTCRFPRDRIVLPEQAASSPDSLAG
jgi:two-component system phosphate regulon sensor histidine kinase PhoR